MTSDLILYRTEGRRICVQCRFEVNTLWLTQAQMAESFQTTPKNITLHLRAIFEEGELVEEATCKEYLQVRREASATSPPSGGRSEDRAGPIRIELMLNDGFESTMLM